MPGPEAAVAGSSGSVAGPAGWGTPCADALLLFPPLQDRSLAGKLEPVSPPSPPHADPELELVPPRLSKEELIQNMDRVDREITMVEQQISKLKKKQVRAGGGGAPEKRAPGIGSWRRACRCAGCFPAATSPGSERRPVRCGALLSADLSAGLERSGSVRSTRVATSHACHAHVR